MKPIKKCNTFGELCQEIGYNTLTDNCRVMVDKAWSIIHSGKYKKIMVSVSGGADSDIMLDLIERIGYPDDTKVEYIWFNTGMEYEATKRHLDYLEEAYGIKIERIRAKVPVPLGCQKYGLPFLTKQIADHIGRLQRNNFDWTDRPYEELLAEYPKCKVSIRWWCDYKGVNSQFSIKNRKWLKEFLMANPPTFPMSKRCCDGAKKNTAHHVEREREPDLSVIGVRKAEGGIRAMSYSSCFDDIACGTSKYRPLYWLKNEDKKLWEDRFEIKHSDCYEVYGFRRTGCACCPFGAKYMEDFLVKTEKYEPKLYNLCMAVFGPSYEYTRKYREFVKMMDEKVARGEIERP